MWEPVLEVPSSSKSPGQAHPLASMWLRVTKELLREGTSEHLSGITGGAQATPRSRPRLPRDWEPGAASRPHQGSTLKPPASFIQPGRGDPQTALCISPLALALHGRHSLHSLNTPPSSPVPGPQLSKSGLVRGFGTADPATFPLYGPRPCPARPLSGSPEGAHRQGISSWGSLPRAPLLNTRVREGPNPLPSFPLPGPTHRCPRAAPGRQEARRRSPRGGKWAPAPRCTGSRPL